MSKTTVKGTSAWLWLLGGLFDLAGLIIVWALKVLGRIGWWLLGKGISHPRTTLGVGVLTGAVLLIGWQWIVGIIGIALLTGSIWKAAHRASFEATIGTWCRTWARKWMAYRRRWTEVMTRCGLVLTHGDETYIPRLKKVRTTPYWDRLAVELQVGQEMSDVESAAGKLRTAFEAERLVVREISPRVVGVELMRRDPFRHETVPPTAMPERTEDIDFTEIPVGLDEHLEPLTVSMVGGHTAVGGMSNSGKGSFGWNLLRGMAPGLADGTVKPIFVDPKRRELRQGLALVDVGVYGATKENGLVPSGDYAVTAEDTVALFQRIVRDLDQANEEGAESGERDFTPSKRTPLRPIFVDELAPLLEYWPRSIKDKLEDLMGIVLTQGRVAGYIMVGCIQETTKDIFSQRDLYARRIALRLPTESYTDAMLTDNAVDRGAESHTIPESLPGVCYSFHERDKKAIRGRLGHVQDADIRELIEFVDALSKVTSIAPTVVDDEILDVEFIDEDAAGSAEEAA